MKTNNNRKIYKILSFFALASLLLIMFLILPLSKEIKKNFKDLVSAKDSIVTLEAQSAEVKNFAQDYQNYKPNLEKLDKLFLNPENLVSFIEFLEKTSSSSQVVSKISLSSSGRNFVMFQISSSGSFFQISDFVKKLELGPYLIEIENLSIQNLEKINAGFTIKVFTKI